MGLCTLSERIFQCGMLLAAFTSVFGASTAARAGYYVDYGAGGGLIYERQDPPENADLQWAVYWFRKGGSNTNPSTRWGADYENSPQMIEKRVAGAQKFEKQYERWCGCDWGPYTFFNPAYPIAIVPFMKPFLSPVLSQEQRAFAAKAHATVDELLDLAERFNSAAELADDSKLKLRGGPIRDFVDAMHKSLDDWMRVNSEIQSYSAMAMAGVETLWDQFQNDAARTSTLAGPAMAALHVDQKPAAGASRAINLALQWQDGKINYFRGYADGRVEFYGNLFSAGDNEGSYSFMVTKNMVFSDPNQIRDDAFDNRRFDPNLPEDVFVQECESCYSSARLLFPTRKLALQAVEWLEKARSAARQ